jgi:uncharacterized membrane protein YqaE (UPF0057 family)
MATSEATRDFVRIVVAWFAPPIGVLLQVGLGAAFWVNLLLTLLFYVPGLVHAVWVISSVGQGGRAVADPHKDFGRLLAAALLPPLGVLLQSGVGTKLLLNVVLTCLFWIPGMLHAAWVITHED